MINLFTTVGVDRETKRGLIYLPLLVLIEKPNEDYLFTTVGVDRETKRGFIYLPLLVLIEKLEGIQLFTTLGVDRETRGHSTIYHCWC